MIYDKLRKLPKVTQEEIYETGDIRLLTEDDSVSDEQLLEIWLKLDEEYKEKYHKNASNEMFLMLKEIEYQCGRYDVINSCVEQLKFSWDDEIAEILKVNGYSVDKSKDLMTQYERIHRESSAILNKVKILQDKLPKPSNNKTSIIEAMMAYSSITGISFDTNTISVEAFHAVEKQVVEKVKQMEKTIKEQKSNHKTK